MPEIRLDNLVKRYGDVEVLHGIELDMADNEFTVLVGPSGCGKSTTLRMIAGLETVSDGEIWVGGEPVSHLEPKERDLAMVFQDYALYPHMNVAQNISFALRLQRRPKSEIDDKVRKVADMVGLTEFLHRKPGALSGGQRQRVAMARALSLASARAELALMSQSVEKNMIYVTHDQIEAMTLADRIVVMNGGFIQQQGTPEDLFRRPVNKFVAGFLGSPPMNFLNGAIEERDGRTFVVGKGFALEIVEGTAVAAKAHSSREVTLGMRPSDLSHDADAPDDAAILLDVRVSEYVGAQSVLLCECGGEKVMVELNSENRVALGQTLKFAVNPRGLHLFDRTTEKAIH